MSIMFFIFASNNNEQLGVKLVSVSMALLVLSQITHWDSGTSLCATLGARLKPLEVELHRG